MVDNLTLKPAKITVLHRLAYPELRLFNNPIVQQSDIKVEQLFPMITEQSDAVFIGLDSVVCNENELLHFASGEIGDAQRDKLHNMLKRFKTRDKAIIIYFPPPLIANG